MDIDELIERDDAIERLTEAGYQPGDAARLVDAQSGAAVPGCSSSEPAGDSGTVEISADVLAEIEGLDG